MAKAKNMVIAGDYEKGNVVLKHTLTGQVVVIKLGWTWKHLPKTIHLNKSTVEAYEVMDETSHKNAVGAVGRAAVGGFFLGLPGLAAALATKNKRIHIVAIKFKDGKRSLLEVDDKIYKAIVTKTF